MDSRDCMAQLSWRERITEGMIRVTLDPMMKNTPCQKLWISGSKLAFPPKLLEACSRFISIPKLAPIALAYPTEWKVWQ